MKWLMATCDFLQQTSHCVLMSLQQSLPLDIPADMGQFTLFFVHASAVMARLTTL